MSERQGPHYRVIPPPHCDWRFWHPNCAAR
jgi:hypothetical protein